MLLLCVSSNQLKLPTRRIASLHVYVTKTVVVALKTMLLRVSTGRAAKKQHGLHGMLLSIEATHTIQAHAYPKR